MKEPKKLTKAQYRKKLKKKASQLWKDYCALRDGKKCMVEQYFPEHNRKHTQVYQADHCFSRAVKALFFHPSNSTMVCSACNMAKKYNVEQVKISIEKIVIDREGQERYDEMKQVAFVGGEFPHWDDISWLEVIVADLEHRISTLSEGVKV